MRVQRSSGSGASRVSFRGQIRPSVAAALLAALAALTLIARPAAAVTGWSGPARVLASFRPYTPSIVVDANAKVHVAWVQDGSSTGDGIWYATNRSGAWRKEQVTTVDQDLFARPSLALDSLARPYIAFARVHCAGCPTNDAVSIHYARRTDAGAWPVTRLTWGHSDLAPSLQVVAGKVHIAYQRFGSEVRGAGIRYITNATPTGSWVTRRVTSNEGSCAYPLLYQFPSLRIRSDGTPLVAYEAPRFPSQGCGGISNGIRVATYESTTLTWARSTVTTNRNDNVARLELDRYGRAHLVFNRAGTGVIYARRTSSGWSRSFVGSGDDPSLAIDASFRAHVTYEGSGVVYATNPDGSWTRTPLTSYGLDEGTSGGPVLDLGPRGKVHLVFARSEGASEDDVGIYYARQTQ